MSVESLMSINDNLTIQTRKVKNDISNKICVIANLVTCYYGIKEEIKDLQDIVNKFEQSTIEEDEKKKAICHVIKELSFKETKHMYLKENLEKKRNQLKYLREQQIKVKTQLCNSERCLNAILT